MDLLVILLTIIVIGGLYTFLILKFVERKFLNHVKVVNTSLSPLITSVDNVHKRIDSLFTVDQPSPNDATQPDPDVSDLSENTIIPDGVKFEVEGGETQVPPEHAA